MVLTKGRIRIRRAWFLQHLTQVALEVFSGLFLFQTLFHNQGTITSYHYNVGKFNSLKTRKRK